MHELSRAEDARYKRELAAFLQERGWHYFFTGTCRKPRKDRLALLRDAGQTIRNVTNGRAFIAVEPHTSGLAHFHGLVHTNGVEPGFPATALWHVLYRRFGRSKVELIKSQENVAAYCAKYVAKGQQFEYDFIGDRYAWKW